MSKLYNVQKNIRDVLEKLGGSEVAKPHSTKEGRVAAGARKFEGKFKKTKS